MYILGQTLHINTERKKCVLDKGLYFCLLTSSKKPIFKQQNQPYWKYVTACSWTCWQLYTWTEDFFRNIFPTSTRSDKLHARCVLSLLLLCFILCLPMPQDSVGSFPLCLSFCYRDRHPSVSSLQFTDLQIWRNWWGRKVLRKKLYCSTPSQGPSTPQ